MARRRISLTGVLTILLVAGLAVAQPAPAPRQPLIREGVTQKISPHVFVIPDDSVPMVPNVGIIVGDRGVLMVDTGMGVRNGAMVLREAQKAAPGRGEMYLVITHFHPEHDLGAGAFPASVKMIRSQDQQRDIAEFGLALAQTFSRMSPLNAELRGLSSARPTSVSTRSTRSIWAACGCGSWPWARTTPAATRWCSSRAIGWCSRAMWRCGRNRPSPAPIPSSRTG